MEKAETENLSWKKSQKRNENGYRTRCSDACLAEERCLFAAWSPSTGVCHTFQTCLGRRDAGGPWTVQRKACEVAARSRTGPAAPGPLSVAGPYSGEASRVWRVRLAEPGCYQAAQPAPSLLFKCGRRLAGERVSGR